MAFIFLFHHPFLIIKSKKNILGRDLIKQKLSITSKVYGSEGVAFWYFTLGIGLLQYKLWTHGKG